MNTIFERNMVLEKSLSRIWSHMLEHDSGIISGYRSTKYRIGEDGKVEFDTKGTPVSIGSYTHSEKEKRNTHLRAMLQAERYQVTSVEGMYVENFNTPYAKEVAEHAFSWWMPEIVETLNQT